MRESITSRANGDDDIQQECNLIRDNCYQAGILHSLLKHNVGPSSQEYATYFYSKETFSIFLKSGHVRLGLKNDIL